MYQEESTSTSGPPHPSPATEVSDAGTLAEGKRPRKRRRDHTHGKGHGIAAKAVKLFKGEPVPESTPGKSLTVKAPSFSLSSTGVQGVKETGTPQLDSSRQSDLGQGSSQGSTSPADEEERSNEGGSAEFGDKMAYLTLKEGVMTEKYLTLDSLLLDLDALPEQSSFRLSDESIPELLDERLEFLIAEALEAEEGALLEPWILDPEAPVPASSASGTSHAGDEEESSNDSAATQEEHGGEAGGSSTSDAPAGVGQTPLTSPPLSQQDYANHPFYHLPSVAPSVLQGLRGLIISQHRLAGNDFYALLNLARALLAKQSLTLPEAEQLHICAQVLRNHARSRLMNPLTGISPFHFAHALALRFLLADTLWCACDVLGESLHKDSWWRPLMEGMLAISNSWSLEKLKRQRSAHRVRLVQMILGVVNVYKAGQRPSSKDVVRIKQTIFCGERLLTIFKQKVWDPWREADASFRTALGKK